MARFVDELEAAVTPLRREFFSAAFFRHLAEGSLTREHYTKLLVEIYHYVKHSTRLLALAAGHTSPLRADLFRRFVAHIGEESGHEAWALSDLKALGVNPEPVIASTPCPHTDAMVGLQYFLIQHCSPLAVLGYIYALETLGSGAASPAAERLKQVLHIGDDAVTFLRGHSESDVEHVEKLQALLTQQAQTAAEQQVIVRSAVATYVLYRDVLDWVCEPRAERAPSHMA